MHVTLERRSFAETPAGLIQFQTSGSQGKRAGFSAASIHLRADYSWKEEGMVFAMPLPSL